jgi:uncharacterized protein with HEPN domain
MQSISNDRILDMLEYVGQQGSFIIETTKGISCFNDFMISQERVILYNSTCMCLQTIGETLKQVDNLTNQGFLKVHYPDIPWKSVFGMRNIIAHEYATTDPEMIFNTIREDLPQLLIVIHKIIEDLKNNRFTLTKK